MRVHGGKGHGERQCHLDIEKGDKKKWNEGKGSCMRNWTKESRRNERRGRDRRGGF